MKIGLLSDTHGSVDAFRKGRELISDSDVILHAGDILYHGPRNPLSEGYDPNNLATQLNELSTEKPIFMVKGNCDAKVDEMVLNNPIISPFLFTKLDNLNILVIHGEDYDEQGLIDLGNTYQADVVIVGHTHIPKLKNTDGGPLLVNPGSPAIPKGKTKIPAIGMLDTDAKEIIIKSITSDERIMLEKL